MISNKAEEKVKCSLDSCTGALLNIQVEKTTHWTLVIFILPYDKKNEDYKQEKKKLKPRYMFKNILKYIFS